MDPVERSQQRVDELRALLRDFQTARAGVPPLSRPAGAVGAPGTWTGAAADRVHRDELAPMSGGLGHALRRAEQAIRDELDQAMRSRDRAQAEAERAADG